MTEFRLHGPPGTGKTRTLATSWVPKAARRFGSDKVVICSLTKTAAAEIASRDVPIPQDNIGTLHALAYRAIGGPTIAESKVSEWNEYQPLYRLSVGGDAADEPESKGERGTKGDGLVAIAQVYRHNRIPRNAWREDVLAFQVRWDRWLEETEYIDFTGLIETALDSQPSAPGLPSVFIVDEAQDCSVLELDLVRKWTARAEYAVLAGDGDQAIYGWRGASARAFLSPKIPKENNYHLTQSHRVPKAVHALASRWIEKASYRYAVDYQPRDHPGEVRRTMGSGRNLAPIIAEALDDVAAGKTVMLLATCGFMLRGIIALLRREGIPFHNPFRKTHGGWNPLRGGAGRLLAFLRPDPLTYPGEARLWTWSEAAQWIDLVQAKGTLPVGGKAWIKRLSGDPEKADEVITIESGRAVFGETWDHLQAAFASKAAVPWLRERLLASKERLLEYPVAVADKRGTSALRDRPKLVVGTIHSVKGGQADVVYILPDLSPNGMREWSRPGDGRDGIIRTFYVGMTRAKEQLVLAGRHSPYSIDWGIQ